MFELSPTSQFTKKYTKLIRKNARLEARIDTVLDLLGADPHNPRLKSHKVTARDGDKAFSSRITGDLRIIWRYDADKSVQIIDLLDIGGHSGSNKVYS